VFPLQAELDEKLSRMADLEADLARTEGVARKPDADAAR
jgi:hypothetical protein